MLVDSKRPFYWISGFFILVLTSIVVYSEYQKIADKNSITIFTGGGPVKIRVEFAKTTQELENGLMNRDSLEIDSGMFFVFSNEATRSFWMKDTLIPLDVIFVSSVGRVNEITTLNPCQETEICQSYNSKTPAQYVLEINATSADQWGMSVGDIVELPKF